MTAIDRCACGYPRNVCWRCANPDDPPPSGQDAIMFEGNNPKMRRRLEGETPVQEAERLGVLVLEPRSTYDRALLGTTDQPDDHHHRMTRTVVAVYDYMACLLALMETEGWTFDEANEWFSYNTACAWVGERTPTFTGELKVPPEGDWE